MNYLWPIVTGVTFIDVWTVFHVIFWMLMGSVVWSFRLSKGVGFSICFIVAYLWELFESIAFVRWPEVWAAPESWLNSLVSDPLTCPIGFFLAWVLLDTYAGRKDD